MPVWVVGWLNTAFFGCFIVLWFAWVSSFDDAWGLTLIFELLYVCGFSFVLVLFCARIDYLFCWFALFVCWTLLLLLIVEICLFCSVS